MTETPEEREETETGGTEDTGAQGDSEESRNRPPAAPTDDDEPAGDTDQHSRSDA
jgi:hypothetical protein